MDDKQINNAQASNDVPVNNKVSDSNTAPADNPADNPPTGVSLDMPKTDPSTADLPTLETSTNDPPKTDNTTASPMADSTATETLNKPSELPDKPATTIAQADNSPAASIPVIEPPTEETPPDTDLANKMPTTSNIADDSADDEQAKVTNIDFNGKRILLVEDDEGLAEVYTTRLDVEGFKVKRVPNGEDALAATIEFKPDLILLDVMMPKVSGFEVLDILRNTPSTAKVKIIMLTALSQDSDREKAQSLGVDDYLVKSQVVIADVVDRIKNALSK